jgi:hypothetical protein
MVDFERFWIPYTFGDARENATKLRVGTLNVWVCESDAQLNVFLMNALTWEVF